MDMFIGNMFLLIEMARKTKQDPYKGRIDKSKRLKMLEESEEGWRR